MFEERLRDILTAVYTGRVIVFSTVTARETLFSKGLSPAIFLHKYYAQYIGEARVSFTVKDKLLKQMCQLAPIDVEEIDSYRQDKMNKIIRDKIASKSKLPKQLCKEDLSSKQQIENYLKSLNFFWFEETTRIFLYCLSLDQNNLAFSTLQQPLGLTFVIEIGPGVNVKGEYEKVRKEADIKIKKWFAFNPSRTKNIPVLVILLYNSEKGGSLNEMRILHDNLKSQYNIQNGLICLIEINGAAAKDSIDWSSYPRPTIKHEYKLQPSDPIRLIGDNEDFQLKQYVTNHRQKIRMSLEDRLRWLGARYEQNNTTKNRFFNFFKGQEVDRSYTAEEGENREIADLLFLLGEYKRSLDIYRSLTEKFSGANRQPLIFFNTSQMVQLAKYMCAITGGDKEKAYNSIQKYAEKRLLKQAQTSGKVKLFRYLIYMMYFIHGLRNFNKQFIKGSYYYFIKRCINEQTSSENNGCPSLIPALVHEQYANLNLLYPIPEVRRYAYDVIRVSSKFHQYRLHEHHLRCFLIASYMYQDSFPSIEKYINSTLSRTYLELKKYRFSVQRIQQTWKALLKIYQDTPTQNQEENQFNKLYNSQLRIVSEIERLQPLELTRQTEDCIPVPKISDVLVQIRDEALDTGEGIGSKWQEVGDVFLGEPELTSKGMSKQNMIKILKLFDALSPQQKQLAYRVRNLPSGIIPEAILKRNARQAFVGQPIIISFDMKNYLPLTIDVSNIQLHLKVVRKCTITRLDPMEDKLVLKQGQKSSVTFQLVPQEEGLYELSHISWIFFKMKSIHRFKEPWEVKSTLKSMYFKLNVLERCGQLNAAVKQSHKFYEGQSDHLELILTNNGKQPIQELYLAVQNQQIFGFRMKWLDLKISPAQTVTSKLPIKIPVLKSSDFMKCINKAIILYRTGNTFRVQRVVSTFNVHRVVEILNLSCERISTTLHFLSFSLKHQSTEQQQLNLLKSLVICRGMDVKKIETNSMGTLTHYFFFMRKNLDTDLEEYQFAYHDFPSKNIIKQTYLPTLKSIDHLQEPEFQNDSTLSLYFLWWDKEGKCGVIDPPPIAITATQNSQSLLKLPFNAKVHLDDEVDCNFENNTYAQVEVQFVIKNIFNVKDINLSVQFIEAANNDFFWEGVTERHLCLKFNGEHRMKLKLLATRSGLYNISKSIKYTIMLNKSNSYTRYHSEYQNIYLMVNGPKPSQSPFDFFQQVPAVAFKKSHQQQSLI